MNQIDKLELHTFVFIPHLVNHSDNPSYTTFSSPNFKSEDWVFVRTEVVKIARPELVEKAATIVAQMEEAKKEIYIRAEEKVHELNEIIAKVLSLPCAVS